MIKLAITDLDGTLVDTSRVNFLAYSKAMEDFGYSLTYDYYKNNCEGRHYREFLPPMDSSYMEEIHRKKLSLYKEFLSESRLNTGLVDLLQTLKESGIYVALGTTASRENTLDVLRFHHLESFFDKILTGSEVKKKKPDPECFQTLMEYFWVTPEETLIFEDSFTGVDSAKSSGAGLIVVKW